jgi:hypothetical protein
MKRNLLLGLLPLLLGFNLLLGLIHLPAADHTTADFRQLYTGGYMLRTGHGGELYQPAVQKYFEDRVVAQFPGWLPINHLAYEEILFVPLSLLPYRAAYLLFLGCNLLLLAVSACLLKNRWLMLAFPPLLVALGQGQDSIIMLALFCVAMVLMEKNREFLAGALIGLALFKFQIVLPIAALFFLWKRYRFIAGFAISATVAVLSSVAITGVRQMPDYLRSLFNASMTGTLGGKLALTGMPNLRGLCAAFLSVHWVGSLTILLSVALLVLAASKTMEKSAQWPLAILVASLASYHFLAHDASLLLIPVALLFETSWALTVMVPLSLIVLSTSYGFLLAIPMLVFTVTQLVRTPGSDAARSRLEPFPKPLGASLEA